MPLPRFRWRRRAFRVPQRQDVMALVRYNWGLKLVSLVVACFLWYSINALERDAERLVDLPVSIRRIPPELIVTTPPTKPVTVTIRGPRTILDSVDEAKTRLVVDLSAVTPGEHRIDLSTGVLNPEPPRRVKIVRIQPARLPMTVERLAMRRLPVRPTVVGTPAFGYRLGETTVNPDYVEVSGPAGRVNALSEIRTEPLDVQGVAHRMQRTIMLEFVGDYVTVVPDRVRVMVAVEEVRLTRVYRSVPVTLRGARGALEPATVDLVVEGPERVLDTWRPPSASVVVDAGQLPAGEHRLNPQVELPPGLEAISIAPDTIRVRVDVDKGG